jgi:hypothetical protein
VLQAAELEELGFRTYYDNGSNSHFVDTARWVDGLNDLLFSSGGVR